LTKKADLAKHTTALTKHNLDKIKNQGGLIFFIERKRLYFTSGIFASGIFARRLLASGIFISGIFFYQRLKASLNKSIMKRGS
jgi:hypothetical protein